MSYPGYVYRAFPKMLHRPDGTTCIVQDETERDAKLAEGWYLTPGIQEPAIETATPETKAPAAKRRGSPSKTTDPVAE